MYFISILPSNMSIVDIVHSIYNYILMDDHGLTIRLHKNPRKIL